MVRKYLTKASGWGNATVICYQTDVLYINCVSTVNDMSGNATADKHLNLSPSPYDLVVGGALYHSL